MLTHTKMLQTPSIAMDKEIIDHIFVSRHYYLPNDADYGLIEQRVDKKHIYSTEDWVTIGK